MAFSDYLHCTVRSVLTVTLYRTARYIPHLQQAELDRERRENKQSKKEGMRGLPGMSFFKGIRGKQAPEVKKEKTSKKPLKSVKMAKMKKSADERSTHYDDERKKGEVRLCILSVLSECSEGSPQKVSICLSVCVTAYVLCLLFSPIPSAPPLFYPFFFHPSLPSYLSLTHPQMSPRGKSLLNSFECFVLESPRDQGLRVLWDQRFDEVSLHDLFRFSCFCC
jgi:hypothetical protein